MASHKPENIQHAYYERTAREYDAAHISSDDEHTRALRYIGSFMSSFNVESVLDVGAGTGRGLKYLLNEGFAAKGIEPVQAMIDEGIKQHGFKSGVLTQGSGDALPFPDNSFDVVCEFAVLHHVKEPDRVVEEMTRVARRMVFLSDSNRFGQGHAVARWSKLILYKAGFWPICNFVKTRGKGYTITEGDGLAYSYSAYDSLAAVRRWADEIFILPTQPVRASSWLHPLLTSETVLLAGIKSESSG